MNTNNQNLELWDTIERYLAELLSPRERLEFEELKARDEEVAEMVAFYRSLELKEQYDDLDHLEEEEGAIRETLNGEAGADPLVAAQLAFDQELRLAVRGERLVVLLDNLERRRTSRDIASPGRKNTSSSSGWGWRLTMAMVAALILAIGALTIRGFFSDTVTFSEVPDYGYGLAQDTYHVKTLYEEGNYERARRAFLRLREEKLNSGFYDEETIDIYNFYIALCELRLGKLTNARSLLENLAGKELDLYGQPQELFLGLVYFQLGLDEEARYWLTSAAGSAGNLEDGTPIADVAGRFLEQLENR